MPQPDFNDPRNLRREREGQERISRHPDDLAGTVYDSTPRAPLRQEGWMERVREDEEVVTPEDDSDGPENPLRRS